MKRTLLPVLSLLPFLVSPAAYACGMPVRHEAAPADRVARAWKYLDQKLPGPAYDEAESVADDSRAPKPLRAQADLILGWVDWESGDKRGAMALLDQARKLDPQALDQVRSQHPPRCYWTTGRTGMLALLDSPTK